MTLSDEKTNGTVATLDLEGAEHRNGHKPSTNGTHAVPTRSRFTYPPPELNGEQPPADVQPVLALFCFEEPGGDVTQFINQLAGPLVGRGVGLHVFSRRGFELDAPGAVIHVLGDGGEGTLLERVQEFTHRAC